MGVPNFNSFLRRHGLLSTTYYPMEYIKTLIEQGTIQGKLQIDFVGVFFKPIKKESLKNEHADWKTFAEAIIKYFESDHVELVLDGCQISNQKELAHAKRSNVRAKALASFNDATSRWVRIKQRRVSKLYKLRNQVWELPDTHRVALAKALENVGFTVLFADGEADVLLAKRAANAVKPLSCMALDSDICFADFEMILRPRYNDDAKKMSFTIFKPAHARQVLGISKIRWKLLAVCSGNDYCSLKSVGIRKIFKVIKYVRGKKMHTILRNLCSFVNCNPAVFQPAVDVFIHLKEDFSSNVVRDVNMAPMITKRIAEWKEKCKERRLHMNSDPMLKCQHSRCNSRCPHPCFKHFCDSECYTPCPQLGHNGTKNFYFKYRHICTIKCPTVCEESNASRKVQPRVLGKALPKKKPKKPKKKGILKLHHKF